MRQTQLVDTHKNKSVEIYLMAKTEDFSNACTN